RILKPVYQVIGLPENNCLAEDQTYYHRQQLNNSFVHMNLLLKTLIYFCFMTCCLKPVTRLKSSYRSANSVSGSASARPKDPASATCPSRRWGDGFELFYA